MKQNNINKKQPTYRCYADDSTKPTVDVVGNSLFDLIGQSEPEQTKSFGYILARSEFAMRSFLELVYTKIPESERRQVNDLMKEDYCVDCELMLESDDGSSKKRADIVIRFPKSQYAIIVEAKSLTVKASSKAASFQGQNYANKLNITHKTVVALTNNQESGNCVLWSEIVDMFDEIIHKNKNISLEKDFLNYLLKIKGLMNYYDIEVLSIPAKNSMKGVAQVGIYECPSEEPYYKSRGEHKPLFIAFRGLHGSVKKLYKVEKILNIPMAGADYDALKISVKGTNEEAIFDRIEKYKNVVSYQITDTKSRWVFILDESRSIDLPNEIRYKRNNTFQETNRPLRAYFAAPNKDGIVLFS
jgi:hypothetical protein